MVDACPILGPGTSLALVWRGFLPINHCNVDHNDVTCHSHGLVLVGSLNLSCCKKVEIVFKIGKRAQHPNEYVLLYFLSENRKIL